MAFLSFPVFDQRTMRNWGRAENGPQHLRNTVSHSEVTFTFSARATVKTYCDLCYIPKIKTKVLYVHKYILYFYFWLFKSLRAQHYSPDISANRCFAFFLLLLSNVWKQPFTDSVSAAVSFDSLSRTQINSKTRSRIAVHRCFWRWFNRCRYD